MAFGYPRAFLLYKTQSKQGVKPIWLYYSCGGGCVYSVFICLHLHIVFVNTIYSSLYHLHIYTLILVAQEQPLLSSISSYYNMLKLDLLTVVKIDSSAYVKKCIHM